MTQAPELPRPVRNNNPGDLEAGANWLGLMPRNQMTPAQSAEPRFLVFQGPEFGFRALVILLRNYQREYGLRTIDQLVWRLAPPGENNSGAYAQAISTRIGWPVAQPLNLELASTLGPLAKAIAVQEAGAWDPYWTDFQLSQGLALAHASDTANQGASA